MSIHYSNTQEEDIVINLPDGKKIHGILRGAISPDEPIVVIVHGRPGTGNELLQFLLARYLYEHGINSLRLFMYDFGPNYRDIVDTTLDTHAADFDIVINHLRSHGAKKVFATGHSYGGLTILRSRAWLDATVLWDPTHGMAFASKHDDPNFPEKETDGIIYVPTGHGSLFPKAQDQYDRSLGDNSDWSANKNYPQKFITAGKGILEPYVREYYNNASEPKSIINIVDAHHQFTDNDEVIERLFQETLDWFNAHKD